VSIQRNCTGPPGTLWETEQLLITAEQYRRQAALQGKVSVVVTDSAIALGVLHAPQSYREALAHIVQQLTGGWISMDVLLERGIETSYQQVGRKETVDEATRHQQRVRQLVQGWTDGKHMELRVDDRAEDRLFQEVSARCVSPHLA
jgi:hypothetical protein